MTVQTHQFLKENAVLTFNCVLRKIVVKYSVFSKFAMMEQTLQYQKGNAVQILVFVKLNFS